MVLYKSFKGSGSAAAAAASMDPNATATILGLKVVGGKLMSDGRYGAIVEKVKKGSVADTVGRLLPGMSHRFFRSPPIAHLHSTPPFHFR